MIHVMFKGLWSTWRRGKKFLLLVCATFLLSGTSVIWTDIGFLCLCHWFPNWGAQTHQGGDNGRNIKLNERVYTRKRNKKGSADSRTNYGSLWVWIPVKTAFLCEVFMFTLCLRVLPKPSKICILGQFSCQNPWPRCWLRPGWYH